MPVHFLTPSAGLIALAALLPLALLVLVERRGRRARRLLGLPEPGAVARLELPVALAALGVVLGLAAAQPVVHTERARLSRLDAEAFVAVDTSRSMLAAGSASSRTRLERAQAIAKQVRAGLIDTPMGVGTFTDRPLPLLLPSSDAEAFTAAVEKAIGIERPPPRSTGLTISSFDAVAPIPVSGYFRPGVPHKLLVLITDAESEDFDVGTLRYDFRARPRIGVVLIRVGGVGEQVFGPGGLPEPAYVAPPSTGRALAKFLRATHGHAFDEHDVGGALRVARATLGTGPHKRLGTVSGRTDLAPYFVLAAVFPLGVVLRRRNL
jgi:hypothetical protein